MGLPACATSTHTTNPPLSMPRVALSPNRSHGTWYPRSTTAERSSSTLVPTTVDTVGRKAITSCVLCGDRRPASRPNCGVDNLGKMRDLRVSASRDMAIDETNSRIGTCVHAEELTRLVVRVRRHRQPQQGKTSYGLLTVTRSITTDATATVALPLQPDPMNVMPLEPAAAGKCAGTSPHKCRPEKGLLPAASTANDALGTLSVAAAMAKFTVSDKDAAGHAAIKAIFTARRWHGRTRRLGVERPSTASRSRPTDTGMLVTFAPITKEANWIKPVTCFLCKHVTTLLEHRAHWGRRAPRFAVPKNPRLGA
jgi:hypothetical protein